jgi:SAM-dependent methyltransferase/uncharacterized protein YbaR (Trm112 family)
MWMRFVRYLTCAACKGTLRLTAFKEERVQISDEEVLTAKKRGVFDEDFNRFVESGLLVCTHCKTWFPIARGLPVLLPYTTPLHRQFSVEFGDDILRLGPGYHPPDGEPPKGERFVMNSFSQEWQDYHYDGVLWDQSYDEFEQTFLRELDCDPAHEEGSTYLEVGCGIGVATYLAHKNFKADAVGVDLSIAAMKAAQHYKRNPFLHFVQASAFSMPFRDAAFDLVYSRGVLMFTYSTREAFRAIARYCKPGGRAYIWVYGPGSVNASLLRRVAYAAEAVARPVLSRRPSSALTTVLLSGATAGYMAYNVFDRFRNPKIQKFNYERALHSARDRFTHRYVHRHKPGEVLGWFREAGFGDVELVDWRTIPSTQQENYKRNIGVRGKALLGATAKKK